MSVYKRPPIYAPKSSPSPYQKPSMSMFERLGVTNPAQKKEAAPPSKTLFGKEGYSKYYSMREFARKFPYKEAMLPGTVKRLGEKERLAFIKKELQERGKKFGYLHGLSEKAYRERIVPEMKKEKYKLHIAGKLKEEKLLEREMEALENLRTKGLFR